MEAHELEPLSKRRTPAQHAVRAEKNCRRVHLRSAYLAELPHLRERNKKLHLEKVKARLVKIARCFELK